MIVHLDIFLIISSLFVSSIIISITSKKSPLNFLSDSQGHIVDGSMSSNGVNPALILAKVCSTITNPDPSGNGYYPVYSDLPRGENGFCAYHSNGFCQRPSGGSVRVQFAFFFNMTNDDGCPAAERLGKSRVIYFSQ